MKRIVISALSLALFIGSAHAQTANNATEKSLVHKDMHGGEMAFQKLNLSADQKAQLKTIRENFHSAMADLKKKSGTAADLKTSKEALHQEYKAKMEAVLTPEQKDQLAKMKTDRKERDKDGFGKEATAKNNMQQALSLTADQQDKIDHIRSSYKDKFGALRSDASLTADQRKEQMQTLRKQQQEEMKAVLTPDQIKKWQALRHDHTDKDTK